MSLLELSVEIFSCHPCLVAGCWLCRGTSRCQSMLEKKKAFWRTCLFCLAEDLISRLRFLFWGKSNGTGRDDVSVDPESMVVGTRCNFVCMPAMAREMLFCRCMTVVLS